LSRLKARLHQIVNRVFEPKTRSLHNALKSKVNSRTYVFRVRIDQNIFSSQFYRF